MVYFIMIKGTNLKYFVEMSEVKRHKKVANGKLLMDIYKENKFKIYLHSQTLEVTKNASECTYFCQFETEFYVILQNLVL